MKMTLLRQILATMLLAIPGGAQERPHTDLEETAEALRSDFNANVDKVRLVILLSPT